MDFKSLDATTYGDFIDNSDENLEGPDQLTRLSELGSELGLTPRLVEHLEMLVHAECVKAVLGTTQSGEKIRGKMELVNYLKKLLPITT